MNYYPKFQYSAFLGDREEQLVIRADSWEEFTDLKKKANLIIEKKKSSAPVQQPQLPGPGEAPICQQHNAPMTWREGVSKKTGKPYAFWACATKNPDGSFCNYKPNTK